MGGVKKETWRWTTASQCIHMLVWVNAAALHLWRMRVCVHKLGHAEGSGHTLSQIKPRLHLHAWPRNHCTQPWGSSRWRSMLFNLPSVWNRFSPTFPSQPDHQLCEKVRVVFSLLKKRVSTALQTSISAQWIITIVYDCMLFWRTEID